VESFDDKAARRQFRRQVRSRQPRFWPALIADARITAGYRRQPPAGGSRMGAAFQALCQAWTSDAFLALALYRGKARLQALGVPILPTLLHRLAIAIAQVSIGDSAVVAAGIYLPHGQVVIDGITEIGEGVVIAPFVTIGLRAGELRGPTIESNVRIGTGAKVIGPISVGAGATIGANAVVVSDVPPGTTVVGSPARPTQKEREAVS
jgi:serine O-acetyltransferase